MQNKRYEKLDGLPAYGPMYKSFPNSGKNIYSEGFVVRFFREDGTDWVANFAKGYYPKDDPTDQIIEIPNTKYLLILGSYIIDPNKDELVDCIGCGYDIIYRADNDRLVFESENCFFILESNLETWETEFISCNELSQIEVKGNTISGLTFDPRDEYDVWPPNLNFEDVMYSFTYNLDTRKLTLKKLTD